MHSSTVDATGESQWGEMVVQGFRGNETLELEPYVFIGFAGDDGRLLGEGFSLTTENAHIISEEIRKHAEFAQSVREQENE